MLTTYVALLRGINVGGNNTVAMKKLKATFEALGFESVRTYINSGNIIFSSAISDQKSLVHMIEKGIKKEFGISLKVLVRDEQTLRKVAQAIPKNWKNDQSQKVDVLFLWDEYVSKRTLEKIRQTKGVDTLVYVSGSILWHLYRKNYSKSGMNKFIGTEIYKNMTARNANTVRKLAALV
jgi:uncharacterized protein (DUF1697 family)